MTRLRGIKYFGGKSSTGGRGTGRWIAMQLPNPPGWCYAEPFAGMCGVLLGRQPRGQEIINDTNGDIVNFWRVLRDQPDDLARLARSSPSAVIRAARGTTSAGDAKTSMSRSASGATDLTALPTARRRPAGRPNVFG